MFVAWASNTPSSGPKWICYFPDGTKTIFKLYLDTILELRRSNKTKRYWIKNEEDRKRLNYYAVTSRGQSSK